MSTYKNADQLATLQKEGASFIQESFPKGVFIAKAGTISFELYAIKPTSGKSAGKTLVFDRMEAEFLDENGVSIGVRSIVLQHAPALVAAHQPTQSIEILSAFVKDADGVNTPYTRQRITGMVNPKPENAG